MKRILIIVLMLFTCLGILSAQDIVTADLENMHPEDKLAYLFFYGHEAIAEDVCVGCFLVFDEDMNYIGGWRTSRTPADFTSNIPSNAVSTAQAVPTSVAKMMCEVIPDSETAAKLSIVEDPAVYVVCIFIPEEDMVVSNLSFSFGERLLTDEIVRHGLNKEEFLNFMVSLDPPVTLEMMVETMYRGGATAREIVLEGMGLMEQAKHPEDNTAKIMGVVTRIIFVALLVGATLTVVLLLYFSIAKKRMQKLERKALMEEHNKNL